MHTQITIMMLLLAGGCSGAQTSSYVNPSEPSPTTYSGATPYSSNQSGTDANSGDTTSADEQVSPPNAITGASLFCMSQLDATDIMTQNGVTCRFEDRSGNRYDPATAGAKFTYTLIPSTIANVFNLLTIIDNPSRTYDMTLAVKAFTKEDANAALNNSKLKIDLVDLKSGKILGSETHVVKDVTFDKKPTTWVEMPSVASSRFLDSASGNIWAVDSQKLYTFKDAVTYCQSLSPVGTFIWGVPVLPELLTGRVHGIGTSSLGLKKMGIRSGIKYWSKAIVGTQDPTILPTADSNLYSAELLSGEESAITDPAGVLSTVKQPVVCVAIPPVPAPTAPLK